MEVPGRGAGMSDLSTLLVSTFAGHPNRLALGTAEGFEPFACPGGIDPAWLDERHLAGVQPLGFYLLDEYSQARCACIDFDDKPDHPGPEWRGKAESIVAKLRSLGVEPLTEVSQSGNGCHVWLFMAEPTEAWIPRSFLKAVAASVDVSLREVYPRQDVLSGKGFGSLVRYPLWSQSHFTDPAEEWLRIDPLDVLPAVMRLDGPGLRMLAHDSGLGELHPAAATASTSDGGISARVRTLVTKPFTLLGRRWNGDARGMNDPSGSAVALSIASELVRQYVPTQEIEAAVHEWCETHECKAYARRSGDARREWVEQTVAKSYEFMVDRKEQASSESHTFQTACMAYLQQLRSGGETYFPSGISDFDASIDGVAPGEMCVVAARPSHGKSAFAFQWLDHVSGLGVPCLCISEEMGFRDIGKRRVMSITRVPQSDWTLHPDYNDHMANEVECHHMNRADVHIVEACHSIGRVEEVIDQFCSTYNVAFVVVDYMQLLKGDSGDRYEQVTDISRRLKQAARRNNCALLALSQLNRAIEGRGEFEPKMSDLRESGQIEQDADMIVFLVWPYRADPKAFAANKDEYRILICKRRNGEIKEPRIVTTWHPHRQHVGDIYEQ